ncbi:hypothetical protein NEOLEDRAFT_1127733 [Neolentinus lepideus HHB14362 ss-1]|uniref:Uncharacterized protein n=1 Tax=Neolentinus lepideus HHB14362 ss-1 TaxID=1314782 RepID=A0A165VLP2_9AGAM|nr:hypothetical protein NEOLEDRAFT_1127733 [Neolentinus lepideus HHB14362 ss-1]
MQPTALRPSTFPLRSCAIVSLPSSSSNGTRLSLPASFQVWDKLPFDVRQATFRKILVMSHHHEDHMCELHSRSPTTTKDHVLDNSQSYPHPFPRHAITHT